MIIKQFKFNSDPFLTKLLLQQYTIIFIYLIQSTIIYILASLKVFQNSYTSTTNTITFFYLSPQFEPFPPL